MNDYTPENLKKWNLEHPSIEQLRTELAQVKAENARLEAAINDLDVIGRYTGNDGKRDWWSGGAWLMPGQAIAIINATKGESALSDLLAPTLACLKELREACAAAFRVIDKSAVLDGEPTRELEAAGVKPGFGVRAQQEISRLEALMKNSEVDGRLNGA